MSFPGVQAKELIRRMGTVAISTGAACSSGASSTGTVLRAMGKSEEIIKGTIRFSCGRFTSDAEVWYAAEKITRALTA